MAQLSKKIELYAAANGVANVEFETDVKLRDAGSGVYIYEWNLDIAEPTDTQLASYETAGNTAEALQTVLNNRATSYPTIQEQLDMQYWDGINNTTTWKDAITKVKTDNPKS